MNAGALRHWVTFERLTLVKDSNGDDSEEWVDAFPVNSRMPCEVVALSGRELIAAQAVQSRVTHRIVCRYRPGFNAAMRALLPDGTIFNIEAIVPDTDSRISHSTLLAYSGTNAGGTAA